MPWPIRSGGPATLIERRTRLEIAVRNIAGVHGAGEFQSDTVRDREPRQQRGAVFQQCNLFPHLTARDNVTLTPRTVRKMPVPEADALVVALLERVGLSEKIESFPSELSGGQQQRVAIARAPRDVPEGDAVRRADLRARPRNDTRGAGGRPRTGGRA